MLSAELLSKILALQGLDGYKPEMIAAVFDGHGGYACAEWLKDNFSKYIEKYLGEIENIEVATTAAFLAADKRILAPKSGFMGMVGERGIGGSKCGATGAVLLVFKVL